MGHCTCRENCKCVNKIASYESDGKNQEEIKHFKKEKYK